MSDGVCVCVLKSLLYIAPELWQFVLSKANSNEYTNQKLREKELKCNEEVEKDASQFSHFRRSDA